MKYLQKLGKALMLPVACLPICGILMGIGYLLCPASMQGGDITGVGPMIGIFLVKAGGALIENMALLFVIGVGVGMSDDHDGTGGLAALASWLMITTLLSTGFVTTLFPSVADNADKTLAFNKIANPFIGILAGVIGSSCYNKFKSTKLPDWLSFFSGKRCVAIIAGVVSILVSVVLLFVWPILFGALIIPLGIVAFIVFYVVFRFAILKFDLKTPGREDDDMDETTVKLANDNFTEVAKIILEGVGGKGNVASIDNCITRLRLEIKDYTAVDEKKIKSAGVAGVIRPGKNSVQVVIGTKVQFVADEFKKLCK